ncbi:LacI family DNA-binding transcriptional regulator [Devosia sp.]|uniref:LacI family DNA-binding transcriptional regulator n=1 Tax=Devosia sp. TaxID=1871048 RepID=UPI001AC4471E|nr:LacI family DNA-binding transcriptional regulator [Devosia sp.]MBN9308814.1 LacI family DNA-binding transcriptional regulator [Devosia sp.]
MAAGKGAGARVSMQNVAAYAGVSIATVSKVMQGVSTVLPDNVTRVQNAIEALGYRINPLGAELRRGRRNLVGLIVPSFEEAATGRLIMQLELEVERRGHVLFVASSHASEKREADTVGRMIDWRVAGVLIRPVKGQKGAGALLLEDAGLPAVYVQEKKTAPRFDTVVAPTDADPERVAATMVGALFARLDQDADEPVVHLVQ